MNYNTVDIKVDIRNFNVMNGKILINTTNGVNFNDKILYPKFDEYNSSNFINNQYLFFGNLEKMILYDFSTETENELNPDYSYYWNTFENNKVLTSCKRRKNSLGNKIADYHWFDIKRKRIEKLLFTGKPQCKIIKKSIIITESKFNIKSLSLLTGELQWETNLEPYGEIRKILGVQSEKLWVSMDCCGENKDENSLLALDVNTGQILYQAPTEYDLSDWFIELIPEQNTILSIYGKMSTHKADSPLVEMNATTGVLIRNQRIESLYLENLKIGFWKVLDNKIYFTANKDTLHGEGTEKLRIF